MSENQDMVRTCADCEYMDMVSVPRNIGTCSISPRSFSLSPQCVRENCVKWLAKGSVRTEPPAVRWGYPDDPKWWKEKGMYAVEDEEEEEDEEEPECEACEPEPIHATAKTLTQTSLDFWGRA